MRSAWISGVEKTAATAEKTSGEGTPSSMGCSLSSVDPPPHLMGLTAVTSAASRRRIARARDWLNARRPAEEVLIIGTTLGAAHPRPCPEEACVVRLSSADVGATRFGPRTTNAQRATDRPTWGAGYFGSHQPRDSYTVRDWRAWPLCEPYERARIRSCDSECHHGIKVRADRAGCA